MTPFHGKAHTQRKIGPVEIRIVGKDRAILFEYLRFCVCVDRGRPFQYIARKTRGIGAAQKARRWRRGATPIPVEVFTQVVLQWLPARAQVEVKCEQRRDLPEQWSVTVRPDPREPQAWGRVVTMLYPFPSDAGAVHTWGATTVVTLTRREETAA